jgi:long-chain acyl-CoA synthetase
VGKSDKHRGEVPVAFVSLKEGNRLDPSEIVEFCKQSLAAYKIPHRIIVTSKLPRTSTGKILKRELKKIVNN